MPLLEASLGVEWPNIFCDHKKTSSNIGLCDGWSQTALAETDVVVSRRDPQFGYAIGTYTNPAGSYLTRNPWALRVQFPSGLGTDDRRIFSPRSPDGQMWGAEQMDFESRGYWWYKLRMIYRIRSSSPGTTGGIEFGVRVYNANESRTKDFLIISPAAGSWDDTWVGITGQGYLDNTGWVGTGSPDEPHHCRFIVHCKHNLSGSTQYISVAHASLETLSPIDIGTGVDTLMDFVGLQENSHYLINKDYDLRRGLPPIRSRSHVISSTLPSGSRRNYDPSGGVIKRDIVLPYKFLTRLDYKKLHLLWQYNKGFGQAPSSYFGTQWPIAVTPRFKDFDQTFMCDFDSPEFPLDKYDGDWLPSTEAAQMYGGIVRFAER